MANFKIRFYSDCLKRYTSFEMYIPNDIRSEVADGEVKEAGEKGKGRMKTLFLLHGYTGDAGNWVPEEIAQKYNFAIVIPNGENSFWLDGLSIGHEFCRFLGEELINYVRMTFGLAMNKEETGIFGMSMGGFGALHTALAYPDTFGMAGGMSSALIIDTIAGIDKDYNDGLGNYYYYTECFGDLDRVKESDSNPETLVKKLKASGKEFPKLYVSCGTEDFLIDSNRKFHDFLVSEGVEHEYFEEPGNHDMDFWSKYAIIFSEKMFG